MSTAAADLDIIISILVSRVEVGYDYQLPYTPQLAKRNINDVTWKPQISDGVFTFVCVRTCMNVSVSIFLFLFNACAYLNRQRELN